MTWLLYTLLTLLTPEPYGGCDEAYAYVGSAGHTWCAIYGRL